MNCIIVTDDYVVKNAAKKLVLKTENLELLSTFDDSVEASHFLKFNKVDLVLLDIQMLDPKVYEFAQSIAKETFLMYISEVEAKKFAFGKSHLLAKRFRKGVDVAHHYSDFVNRGKPTQIVDYFVV